MKHLLLILAVLTPICNASAFPKDWGVANTNMEILDWSLMFIDYKQTIRFLKPDMVAQGYYESNKLLGRYPSRSRLIN